MTREITETRFSTGSGACIFGASAAGPSHLATGRACEDAWTFLAASPVDWVIAVADGAGSAEKGKEGAAIAVDTAVREAFSYFCREAGPGLPLAEITKNDVILKESVKKARVSLLSAAKIAGRPEADYACTLIFILCTDSYLSVAHIGDGGVVGLRGDEIILLSSPARSEYVNETEFLTDEDWEKNLSLTLNIPFIDWMAAFTDGCQRAVLLREDDDFIPFLPFFTPLFGYAATVTDAKEGDEEIGRLLSSEKLSLHSGDDKTLVIAGTSLGGGR